MNETGQIIRDSFSFDNSQEGFKTLLEVLKSLDCSQKRFLSRQSYGKIKRQALSN